ncbi:hypothetical protein EDB85DRAFT_2155404 [Lactarius pseudohatsudake]|nr:hypothetical protein EDB85DRAFT_2155404 [Lactarius pseudohatsudake]
MPPPVRATLFAAHEDKECTGFPRVCATPFAWKGAHDARRRPAPPFSPSPHVRTEWGRTRARAVPPFPFVQKRCARGHTARPFPSPFPLVRATPRSRGKGRARATPHPVAPRSRGKERTRPSHPRLPVAQQGRHGAKTGSRRDHAPAPPCPRTQEGGQRAHHVPWHGRRQPSPPPPTHARGGTARPPVPSAWATLALPHAHHTAPPVHARGGVGVQPLRTGHSGPVFTRPAIPADAGGDLAITTTSTPPRCRHLDTATTATSTLLRTFTSAVHRDPHRRHLDSTQPPLPPQPHYDGEDSQDGGGDVKTTTNDHGGGNNNAKMITAAAATAKTVKTVAVTRRQPGTTMRRRTRRRQRQREGDHGGGGDREDSQDATATQRRPQQRQRRRKDDHGGDDNNARMITAAAATLKKDSQGSGDTKTTMAKTITTVVGWRGWYQW